MAEYLKPNRPKKPDGEALLKEGKRWIERIDDAWKLEKTWVDDAEKAVTGYTGETINGTDTAYDFNILYSNVETIVPAIINSPPQPDIRRRFADEDPVAKDVSELLERAIRVQVDDSKLQIEMEAGAQDAFLAGRGIVRLRFKADVDGEYGNDELKELAEDFAEDPDRAEDQNTDGATADADGDNEGDTSRSDSRGPDTGASVKNERICFEAVSWRDYRHGPAKRWEDRPWEAYRHAVPMEDLEAFADKAIVGAQTMPVDKLAQGDTESDVTIWEVWDRKAKKVKFVENDTGKILKIIDDPMGLSCFYPICTPMQPIEITGRLMPVNPFSIYRTLADELDITTKRIKAITAHMRVRGWYSGDATELANMLAADDTDFVPVANPEMWAQNGGLDGAVAFWPLEKFIVALKELYISRDQSKQAIYEITGISDIVRGASMASETATAQNIKSQWGSLRIQKMQRMMERAARDLFVMMAEVIPEKFSAETLEAMTGIQLVPKPQDLQPLPPPPQPPQPTNEQEQQQAQQAMQMFEQAKQQWQQAEQARQQKLAHIAAVNKLLNDNVSKYYRIDVESDSTVRADLTQKKQEQAEFLQGAAAYFQGIMPAVEMGAISQEGAIEIFAASARLFTLGKSTEDALDREISQAKERAKQPKQDKPDPEMVKAQLEQQKAQSAAEMAQAKAQSDAQVAQAKAQSDQAMAQVQMQTIQAKSEADLAKVSADVEAKRMDMQASVAETNAKLEADRQTHALEMQKGALELRKIEAEIIKIQAGTHATVIGAQAKADAAKAAPKAAAK